MDNNAFDEALRRVAEREKLPYADDAWTRIAARLDAHDSGKKGGGLVIPVPVVRWVAAAAVVLLALAAGWWLRDAVMPSEGVSAGSIASAPAKANEQTGEGAQNAAQTSVQSSTHQAASVSAKEVARASQGLPVRVKRNNSRASIPNTRSVANVAQAPAPNSFTPSLTNEAPRKESAQVPVEGAAPSPAVTPAPRPKNQTGFAFFPSEDAPKAARSMGFDLAGGYGFSSSLSTFSVGVAVKRDVGRRVRFEGGLALLGGAQSTTQTVTETVYSMTNSGGVGSTLNPPTNPTFASHDSSYTQPGRERLLYLQAAPTVSYRIYKGFSAGGGLDAQRLLGAPPLAMAKSDDVAAFQNMNNVRVSEPAQAEWDFGFALRADYQITKGLRIGIQHRESLRATADGARAIGRSYWLLQAGFRLR